MRLTNLRVKAVQITDISDVQQMVTDLAQGTEEGNMSSEIYISVHQKWLIQSVLLSRVPLIWRL